MREDETVRDLSVTGRLNEKGIRKEVWDVTEVGMPSGVLGLPAESQVEQHRREEQRFDNT